MISQFRPPGSENRPRPLQKSLCKTCVFTSLILIFSPHVSFAQMPAGTLPDNPVVIFTPTLIPLDNIGISLQVSGLSVIDNANTIELTSTSPPTENIKSLTSLESHNLEPIEVYMQTVSDFETEGGAYNEELIEALESLAFAYRQLGEQELAIEAYSRAIYIARVNSGLDGSGLSAHLIESFSDTLLESGDVTEASIQRRFLLYLRKQQHQDNYGELFLDGIEYANWNFKLATSAHHFNLTENIFSYRLMTEAAMLYSAAVSVTPTALYNFNGSDSSFGRKIIEANYYRAHFIYRNGQFGSRFSHSIILPSEEPGDIASRIRYPKDSWRNYAAGQIEGAQALISELDFIKRQESVNNEQVVRAMLNLADWSQIYSDNKTAKALYQEVYTMLRESDINHSDTLLTELFQPALPQQIPAFIPSDYSRQAFGIEEIRPKDVQGYIDISFRVDRHGQTGRIKILNVSPDMDNTLKEALKYDISTNLYRPRYEDGKPVREVYALRYYVSSVN